MKLRTLVLRLAAYAWTAPNTLLGFAGGTLVLLSGGRAARVQGAIEFTGGWLGRLLGAAPSPLRFDAVTLGHTILGVDEGALAAARAHEHVHVRQYERWGPFFLPAYFGSSAWQLVSGGRVYRDNRFEKQAFAQSALNSPRGAPAAP